MQATSLNVKSEKSAEATQCKKHPTVFIQLVILQQSLKSSCLEFLFVSFSHCSTFLSHFDQHNGRNNEQINKSKTKIDKMPLLNKAGILARGDDNVDPVRLWCNTVWQRQDCMIQGSNLSQLDQAGRLEVKKMTDLSLESFPYRTTGSIPMNRYPFIFSVLTNLQTRL